MLGWIFKRQDAVPKSAFLNTADFESLWAASFRWLGIDPQNFDAAEPPDQVKQITFRLIRGFYTGDVLLRRQSGYKVPYEPMLFFIMDLNPWRKQLWGCQAKGRFDKAFLSGLYIERSNILSWCAKMRIEPPPFWTPAEPPAALSPPDEDDDDKDGWYERLTEQRRRRVACLELARHLWKQDRQLSYEAVRLHALMKQAGLHSVFTPDTFKKWSRDFAPEEAKQGGRRAQTST